MKTDIHRVFADCFNTQELKSLAYELSSKLSEGHICISEEFAKRESEPDSEANPFVFDQDAVRIDTSRLRNVNPHIGNATNLRHPFVYHREKYYIQRYFLYECEILNSIQQFVANEHLETQQELLLQHKSFVCSLFADYVADAKSDDENVQWQAAAALSSAIHNFSIITGGPGTGKTTTVAKLLAILFTMNPECKVALAAPTGKAAARMKESLIEAKDSISVLTPEVKQCFDALGASTIHRLLGYQHKTHYFKHDESNFLDCDVVIVDESSMVGVSMMAKLMNAVNPKAKLVLLGDKDQLASVEAGSILGDICLTQSLCVNKMTEAHARWINRFITVEGAEMPSRFITDDKQTNPLFERVVELQRSYRFKGEEAIGVFSKAVIENSLDDSIITKCAEKCTDNKTDKEQSVTLAPLNSTAQFNKLYNLYRAYIEEPNIEKALKSINKVRILCAVKSGEQGVEFQNYAVESFLAKQGLLEPSNGFYHNQPIMITSNDYNLGLFNGDVGLVRKNEKGELIAYFETADEVRSIHSARISRYQTVFAMTIHKSQGSEFDHVGVVLPKDSDTQILTRELIYTGITRAKKSAVVFGSKEVLLNGCERQVERASGLTDRLLTEITCSN